MPTAEELIAQIEEANRAHEERVAAIMGELKQAGWTQEQLFTRETLVDSMARVFTADEMRVLAGLKAWPQSKPL